MLIERFLEKEVKKYLDVKEIIAIIGPRQAGKTTLLKKIHSELKDSIFLDFEDRETLDLFQKDIKTFIALHINKHKYVFIDEFQYAKEGGKNLKYIYDNHQAKIIISGSSASELSIQGIKYLTGRIFIFKLYPLSFKEFLNYKNKELYKIYSENPTEQVIKMALPYFKEFCLFGGYPRVALSESKEEKITVLKNIHNTYLLKEIREILGISDENLNTLAKLLALQMSGMISLDELSKASSSSYENIKLNLGTLEKTFIGFKVMPYYKNKRTEITKTPKFFFVDTGFRNAIIDNFQDLEKRTDKGAIYECFAASELIKAGIKPNYWRTKSKAEVDFIIEINNSPVPIEVKSKLISPKITRSLHSFIEKHNPEKAIVLSEELYADKGKIKFRPIFLCTKEC